MDTPTGKSTVTDWASTRGEKWRLQLAGLEAMLRPLDAPLIRALDLSGPCRIADVGCGGGATTLELRRRAPAGTVVHGFDLSPTLIDAARDRMPPTDDRIAFAVADMGKAVPPGHPYDRLVSRLGIMFFDDPPTAFANLGRWLVPGGRCAFAVWGPLADNVWMTTIREAVGEVIDLPPLDPAAPGPFRYGDATVLLSLLERAGFDNLDVVDWRGTLPIGDRLPAADAARFALASFSSFAELLTDAGADALGKAQRALRARLAADERDGVVAMSARVHIVVGISRGA